MTIIPFQQTLRPAIPTVRGNIEYSRLEEQLIRMDELLRVSGVEDLCASKSVARYKEQQEKKGTKAKISNLRNHQERAKVALRCMILKNMLGASCREMSLQLAQSALYQWFCRIERGGDIKVPSKSQIQGYIHIISEEELGEIVIKLLSASQNDEIALAEAVALENIWIDSTCVKTNIHYPVDWVLLRDATRTLTKSVSVIRKAGLKVRMSRPADFLSRMNSLCIQMTQCRRRKDSKKKQKETLREMKKLVTTVRKHAERHAELLDKEWGNTDLTRKQAEVILRRMQQVFDQLPAAQKQAHERIIGERQIENEEKILSFYEEDTNVIVRGKAGAAVEFGNTLYLAEQSDGLIVDWKFFKESAAADSALLQESVKRIESSLSITIKAIGGDKGFDSAKNQDFLQNRTIFNGIAPKNPHLLKEKLKDTEFKASQKRRASTEARIGIFKNCFLGKILRAKGFQNRSLSIAWGVLAHNLWLLARLPKKKILKLAA